MEKISEAKRLIKDELKVNSVTVEKIAIEFIKANVLGIGFSKVVLGLSGGLDSSLVAYFSCQALGSENVHVVLLPYKLSAKASKGDAMKVIKALKIPERNVSVVSITPQIDAWLKKNPISFKTSEGRLRFGNKLARERMAVLYDKSADLRALVIGTSNMSELLVGYGTIFGDMAYALNPVGNLYKSQERQLASEIPGLEFLAQKTPTADLLPGQTDETDLGMTYKELDEILFGIVDMRFSREDLLGAGYNAKKTDYVIQKVIANHFKRAQVPIAKMNRRTVPVDFLYLRIAPKNIKPQKFGVNF